MTTFRYVLQDEDTSVAGDRLAIIRTTCPVSTGDVVMWPGDGAAPGGAARVLQVCHVDGADGAVLRVRTCPLHHNPAYTLEAARLLTVPL